MQLLGTAFAGASFVAPLISTGIDGDRMRPINVHHRLNPKTLEKDFEEILLLGSNGDSNYELLGQMHTAKCDPISDSPAREINVYAAKLEVEKGSKFYSTIDRLRSNWQPN